MHLGVIMVTYNRLSLLKEAVNCIRNQSLAFEKIIIIDNCSTDGTDRYLDSLRGLPEFAVCRMRENTGGAGGFAAGIEMANRIDLDWVLLIDDDAMIERDYVKKLMAFAKKHPRVNACSGTVMTEGKITTIHRRNLSNSLLFIESEIPEEKYQKKVFHYDLSTFCGLMIRGEVMREIGIPEGEYFIWYDDTEYCLRLKDYGGIYNVNSAVLNHKTREVKNKQSYFLRTDWKYYYGQRNRLYTAKKHCGRMTAVAVYMEMVAFLAISLCMYLNPGTREKSGYNIRMLGDAIRDSFKGLTGKNNRYIPKG